MKAVINAQLVMAGAIAAVGAVSLFLVPYGSSQAETPPPRSLPEVSDAAGPATEVTVMTRKPSHLAVLHRRAANVDERRRTSGLADAGSGLLSPLTPQELRMVWEYRQKNTPQATPPTT